jgi:hypothetical protein
VRTYVLIMLCHNFHERTRVRTYNVTMVHVYVHMYVHMYLVTLSQKPYHTYKCTKCTTMVHVYHLVATIVPW